jgi:hypothetical protein
MFDAMLNEVLQTAIKSEESFNVQLQREQYNITKLKEFIVNTIGMTPEAKSLFLQLFLA